jgi:hypothetical protein
MSDFVEQCRREWKRLGVPDPLAEEMAADLAVDLEEAEAEGVSVQELLGAGAFDAPSFAASWAAERGIIPAKPPRGNGRRKPIALVAFTAVAAFVLVVTALALAAGKPEVSLVAVKKPGARLLTPSGGFVLPGPTRTVMHTNAAAAPVEWILLLLALVALGFAAWLWSSWNRSRPPSLPA